MSTIVKFENVVAVAGSFPVLTGVDISVQEGEIVLLQGKNGAGKTSFCVPALDSYGSTMVPLKSLGSTCESIDRLRAVISDC